jgi:hypothetical protein
MRDVAVLKVEILGLETALHEVIGVVDQEGEEFCNIGCKEEKHCKVLGISEFFLKVIFQKIITREKHETANHRTVKHG